MFSSVFSNILFSCLKSELQKHVFKTKQDYVRVTPPATHVAVLFLVNMFSRVLPMHIYIHVLYAQIIAQPFFLTLLFAGIPVLCPSTQSNIFRTITNGFTMFSYTNGI